MIGDVLGVAGLATGVIGGLFQRSAAKKAAQIQHDSDVAAALEAKRTAESVNPEINAAATKAGDDARRVAAEGAEHVNTAVSGANNLLQPFTTAGTDANNLLAARTAPGGEFDKTFTPSDLTQSPGYQFRLNQGLKALTASAAARGAVSSSGRAIEDYAQNSASQEFENEFQRFRQDRQDRFNNLNTLAGRGVDTATTQGKNLLGGSEFGATTENQAVDYAGNKSTDAATQTTQNTVSADDKYNNYLTHASDATASGIVGGSNALWGGISGGVGALTSGLTLESLLKNPAGTRNFLDVSNYGKPPLPGYASVRPHA